MPANAVTTYAYDSQNRLVDALEKTSGGSANASRAYGYDADGNITSTTIAGSLGSCATLAHTAGTYYLSYDADDELTWTSTDEGSSWWGYENAGHQTQDGICSVATTYNDRGGVATQGTGTYTTYGAGNDPTYHWVDGSTTSSYTDAVGLGMMGESPGSQAYDRTPDGAAVAARIASSTSYYYVEDVIGSVVGLFDKNGAYLGGCAYTPYGDSRFTGTNAAAARNKIRYAGGYYDASSGYYRCGARYYNAATRRFAQQDPSEREANLYAYATNNPINVSDLTGLIARAQVVAIGMALLFSTILFLACLTLSIFGCALVGALAAFFSQVATVWVNARYDGYTLAGAWAKVVKAAKSDGQAWLVGGFLAGILDGTLKNVFG